MTQDELKKEVEETVKRNVCGHCNQCKSHGYIGCDIYKYSKRSFIAGAKEVRKENKRAKVLLKATFDLLQKQKESHYVLNLLENTVFYDNAECDGYCLFDDIENFLNYGS